MRVLFFLFQIKDVSTPAPAGRVPSEAGNEDTLGHEEAGPEPRQSESQKQSAAQSSTSINSHKTTREHRDSETSLKADDLRRQPSKGDEPFEKWERDEMEKLLGELRGHLVLYPTRFLEGEDVSNNFLFNADRCVYCQPLTVLSLINVYIRLLPMPIYD